MERLLNDGWGFVKLGAGSTRQDALNAGFAPVGLPHDWLIWQTDDLYETGDGWYRRTLSVPDDGMCRILSFDGVSLHSEVWVNGTLACAHCYGYTAFDVELTPCLHPGENELMVHIMHRSPSTRWYAGAGIYRDVTLRTLPKSHIVPNGVYVHTEREGGRWKLRVRTETVGAGDVTQRLYDAQGSLVAAGNGAECVLEPESVRPWSCGDPYLYRLETRMGEDGVVQRVGFRTLEWTTDRGLFLNGVHVKLHGVCLHHDQGALGAAFHEAAERRRLTTMKEMGVNALRTSHNPPAKQVMDLCDEMGILVVDEAFDMWYLPKTEYDYGNDFAACEEADVASWVRRDRNHPSLCMWSIGNEILDTHVNPDAPEVTRMLRDQVRMHDPLGNGAVTIGLNYLPWEGAQRCCDVLKNAGYNYGENLYEAHHAKYPDWVIYGSETSSMVFSRGIYHFPAEEPILSDADLQCSALGNSVTSYGAQDVRRLVMDDLHTPYSLGQFLWTGGDYIGEPTPYHTRSSYFGLIDTAGFPKDLYHFFRAWWADGPMVHIGVYWDWNPGQLIDVNVMTNAAAVELLLNGRSLGVRRVKETAEGSLPGWKVPYEPGELRAVAYHADGTVAAQDVRRSFGDSVRIRLRANRATLRADGRDLAYVEVTAEDEQGRAVENANDRVRVRVRGCGCLLGMDNGDSTDTDPYKTDSRRLFSGKAVAIIGSYGVAGEIRVEATGDGLQGDALVLRAEEAAVQPGTGERSVCPETVGWTPRHVRRIELTALDDTHLTPQHPQARIRWRTLPANAMPQPIEWELTNAAAIESRCASLRVEGDCVNVRAAGDGTVYLRAMCRNGAEHVRILSQLELTVSGFGRPYLDPYGFVYGGLYDGSRGKIGAGNEKGLAFARGESSAAGFGRVDFGPDGSDEITVPLFTYDDEPYELELYDGTPGEGGERIAALRYQQKHEWNVYKPQTWRLPRRLKGVHELWFRMETKVHMKGFSFAVQSRAWQALSPLEADAVYGDSFTRAKDGIRGIGNNVTLVFERMDFGDARAVTLTLDGATPLATNPITVRVRSVQGAETVSVADFTHGAGPQRFWLRVPGGRCTVSFVFLPGSQFDFSGFRFERAEE